MKLITIKKTTVATVFVVGNAFSSSLFAQNLITNPTFDVDASGWTGTASNVPGTNFGVSIYPQYASGRIESLQNNNSGVNNLAQTVNIQTAGTYELSFSYGFRSGYNLSLRSANNNTGSISLGGGSVADIAITNSGSTNNGGSNQQVSSSVSYTAIINGVSSNLTLPMTIVGTQLVTNTYSAGWTRLTLSKALQAGAQTLSFNWNYFDTGLMLDNISLIFISSSGPTGPSAEDTHASMTPNANALRGAYSLQSAIINTGLSYDCTTFDKNGICVSAGGRVTDTNNPSTNSQGALLIASYRANEQWRVGAYLDQNLSSNDARGVNLDNNNPMGGVFAVWNQNTDGTGYQVRLASGYSDKDVTISRSAFGATGEAGKGDSSLQSQAYSATLSRGFQLNNTRWIASPYLGVRYTKIKRAGYKEDSSAEVTTPLTYSALSQETTTALVGVRFNGQLGDKINLMASAGIENDIAHNTGDYAATGVDGLTPVAFNQNIRHIRPVASAGASYAIDKRQTVGANLNFRQEAFNSTNSVSGMVTYQVGF